MLCVRPLRLLHQQRLRHGFARDLHAEPFSVTEQEPFVASEDGLRTLRKRHHGNSALPVPPFLDPIAVKARHRFTAPKPSGHEIEKNDFQKELEANPFAQALATPVRQCGLTNARLPSHFLIPIVTHITPPTEGTDTNGRRQPTTVHLSPDLDLHVPREYRSSSRSYVLAQSRIVRWLTERKKWRYLVSERMRNWLSLKLGRQSQDFKVQKEWEWDANTEEKVLNTLREEVLKALEAVTAEGLFTGTDNVENKKVVGVLRFDQESESAAETISLNCGTPIYDMQRLLGAARCHSLPSNDRQGSNLAVLQSPYALRLQSAMVRLEAYLRNGVD